MSSLDREVAAMLAKQNRFIKAVDIHGDLSRAYPLLMEPAEELSSTPAPARENLYAC